jgi:hypothetical protein
LAKNLVLEENRNVFEWYPKKVSGNPTLFWSYPTLSRRYPTLSRRYPTLSRRYPTKTTSYPNFPEQPHSQSVVTTCQIIQVQNFDNMFLRICEGFYYDHIFNQFFSILIV